MQLFIVGVVYFAVMFLAIIIADEAVRGRWSKAGWTIKRIGALFLASMLFGGGFWFLFRYGL